MVIYIIGAAGRTGALFVRELQGAAGITGVVRAGEAAAVKAGKIKIKRGQEPAAVFAAAAIIPDEFAAAARKNPPDFVWLAARNPVAEAVKFYYQHFNGWDKIPALVLSQNGLSAIGDAKAALAEVLGQGWDKVEIVRVSLLNGVDLKFAEGDSIINYKLPIKLGFGGVSGCALPELKKVFDRAGIRAQEFSGPKVLAMENSKLFLNLIGMASAVAGLDAAAGWRDKKIFAQEIAMLKEFARVARFRGGFAANFCGYPVKLMAGLTRLPAWLLLPFRNKLANVVARGRNRPKDLSEIDYYNGEVARLGKQFGVATPINEAIAAKAKQIIQR